MFWPITRIEIRVTITATFFYREARFNVVRITRDESKNDQPAPIKRNINFRRDEAIIFQSGRFQREQHDLDTLAVSAVGPIKNLNYTDFDIVENALSYSYICIYIYMYIYIYIYICKKKKRKIYLYNPIFKSSSRIFQNETFQLESYHRWYSARHRGVETTSFFILQ